MESKEIASSHNHGINGILSLVRGGVGTIQGEGFDRISEFESSYAKSIEHYKKQKSRFNRLQAAPGCEYDEPCKKAQDDLYQSQLHECAEAGLNLLNSNSKLQAVYQKRIDLLVSHFISGSNSKNEVPVDIASKCFERMSEILDSTFRGKKLEEMTLDEKLIHLESLLESVNYRLSHYRFLVETLHNSPDRALSNIGPKISSLSELEKEIGICDTIAKNLTEQIQQIYHTKINILKTQAVEFLNELKNLSPHAK